MADNLTKHEFRGNIETNLGLLKSDIWPKELVDMLVEKKILTTGQAKDIHAETTKHNKNGLILDILITRSEREIPTILQCFIDTNQSHIAEIIRGHGGPSSTTIDGQYHCDGTVATPVSNITQSTYEETFEDLSGTTGKITLEDGSEHENKTSVWVSNHRGSTESALETAMGGPSSTTIDGQYHCDGTVATPVSNRTQSTYEETFEDLSAEDDSLLAVIGGKACKGKTVEVWKSAALLVPNTGSLELRIMGELDASCCEEWKSNCKTSACYKNKKIYVLQLYKQFGLLEYDFERRRWSKYLREKSHHITNGFIFSAKDDLYFYGLDAGYHAMVCLELKESQMYILASQREIINDFAVAGSRDYFYVIGGKSVDFVLPSVDRFSVSAKTWQSAKQMGERRRLHSAVQLDNHIYVCGGKDQDGKTMSSCEVYSIADDQWRATGSMCSPRHSFSLIAFRGKLLAIGGFSTGPSQVLSSIEIYTPDDNSWSLSGTSLKDERCEHASVVFPDII